MSIALSLSRRCALEYRWRREAVKGRGRWPPHVSVIVFARLLLSVGSGVEEEAGKV